MDELNNLEADASAKHAEFSVILGPLDLDKVARSEGEKRLWSIETMDRWLCNLTELVEDVREQAENVNWVAEETHSTLISPSRASQGGDDQTRQFQDRLQSSEERGFLAEQGNLNLKYKELRL